MTDEPLCTCGHFKSQHTTQIENCEDTPGCTDPECWCTEFDPDEVSEDEVV